MIRKFANLQSITDTGVVLIVRLESADEAYSVAEAAIEGGIRALEITLSVPGAHGLIERLAAAHRHEGILIGAGTVLDAQSAYTAINAGAELLVSPNLDPEMIAVGNRYQAVTMSGAFTPTEILNTSVAGADIVKLFPAEFVGPSYVKTVLAPLSQIPIAPAGGVTAANAKEWFDAGVASVGVGSAITKAARPSGDYALVTTAAREFLSAVAEARS